MTTKLVEVKPAKYVSFADGFKQTLAMAQRALIRMWRTPEQSLDVLLMPIIFTVMFTYIFGGAISGNVKSYLPIIIPGIIVQTVISASIVTGVNLREDMDKGVFDRFRAMPIARIAPLAGALMADLLRYIVATSITLITGYFMGFRPKSFGGVLLAIALVTFTAWCVSWIFAFAGLKARSAAAVNGISMMIMFPLTFLSNAFVDPKTMPSWLQKFVEANPLSHLITAVRELLNQGHIGQQVVYTLVGALIIVAIFMPLCLREYMKKS
ncbi:MAG: ABC transporter permease [Micrococcaceae bacterium]